MLAIRSKLPIFGGIVIIALAMIVYMFVTSNKTGNPFDSNIKPVSVVQSVGMSDLQTAREATARSLPLRQTETSDQSDMDRLRLDLIEKMKLQYSATITSIAVQVSLKDFLADLLKSYPEVGKALFESIIRGAFSDLADDILSVVYRMQEYDEWLLDNARYLGELNELEYNGTVWQKRESLFGENAKLIWSSELTAQEDRRRVLQQTVSMLDSSHDTLMEERIYILKSAFEEQYSESIESHIYDTRGVLSQVLFGFSSVQDELSKLSVDERQAEINSIRRQLGYDEESIAYMESIDQKRDERWQNGYRYMEARDKLTENLNGDQLEQALDKLRVEFFKHEAPTIAREEMDEFFRFKRPRFYGRN